MSKSTTVAELRTQAEEAAIEIPEGATKAQIEALLEPPVEAAPGQKLESLTIPHVTERGDWEDPFGPEGNQVFYGEKVSPYSGAQREGDQAVRAVPDAS